MTCKISASSSLLIGDDDSADASSPRLLVTATETSAPPPQPTAAVVIETPTQMRSFLMALIRATGAPARGEPRTRVKSVSSIRESHDVSESTGSRRNRTVPGVEYRGGRHA